MELEIALAVVGVLIAIVGVISGIISFWLMIKYLRFNRIQNSLGMSGVDIARKILDDHDLQHIKVKRTGSLLFGNSYSHYFKKVRLRGFIRHETSLTSLGLGAQKASLALLDKEGDPDMKKRIRITPFISIGPFAFIPLILVGVAVDFIVYSANSSFWTILFTIIAALFYAYSLMLSVLTLKTEKKAQNRAFDILENEYHLPANELEDIKDLFHLYNIQYINDIILSSLELIYYVLKILIALKGNDTK